MANPLKSFAVELQPHNPEWRRCAREEADVLKHTAGETLLAVHHVGSTSIPNIRAKPIIDLLPVVEDLRRLDLKRAAFEALGYVWKGELGLPGRRYCFRDDPESGKRVFQLHCYQHGSKEIERHLAFRDYLIATPHIARRYEAEKLRCQTLHRDDHHAYGACKSTWIDGIEADALKCYRNSGEG